MDFSKLLHGFVKIDVWISSKLLHGFVKIDKWIKWKSCSLYFSPFAKHNQAEVSKISKIVEASALN